ncbi:MAG: hypothetical protein J7D61_07900 [Marichromatium sp.]|nr:hypothetical protein [Marichromatium sp.]
MTMQREGHAECEAESRQLLAEIAALRAQIDRLLANHPALGQEPPPLTADQWRALKGLYLSHGQKVALGRRASILMAEAGLTPSRQKQRAKTGAAGAVNVYPQAILAQAAAELGLCG